MNRQHFANTVRTFAENAIAHDDPGYGRQLATMFERYAILLRLEFGGHPQWATSARTHVQARRRNEE